MKSLEALTELLIKERKKRKLSQKDMRMLIGMSQQQYQRIESGNDLKISTLFRVLQGLGLELSINDPSQVTQNQKVETTSIDDDFWLSKNKHLED